MSKMSDYRAPRFDAPDDRKVGWFDETFKQAQAFLQSQRAFLDIERGAEFIAGMDAEVLPESYSRVDVNMGKRQIRENVATLANVRPLWGFQTDQKPLEAAVAMRNRALKGWHQNTFFDRGLEDTLKYTAGGGTGYLRPRWDPNYYAPGRGEIATSSYGAGQVFPVQIGKDHDLQKAYAVIIHHEVPLHQAHAAHPTKAHLITADREGTAGGMKKVLNRIQRWLSPALNVGGTGRGQQSSMSIFPVADIYEIFVQDLSINETGKILAFGKPQSSWYYEVPYVGMEIPAGYRNTAGQMLYRKAMPEDCLLYPMRRRMEFSSNHCLTDDTQEEWHGKVPLVKFQLDSWPWEYLGFGMPRDYKPIQDSNRRILRAIDDKINSGLDPSLEYDDDTISKALMEEFDPRQPGQHLGTPMSRGNQVKPLFTADYYAIPPGIFEHVDRMFKYADYLIGTPALAGLAGLRQLPSDQSIEKIQEAMGALVWDMSRNVEQGLAQFGEMWKCMSFQRYDTRRMIQMVGVDGVTPEILDFDPTVAVPAHMPNEDERQPSQFNLYQRARHYMNLMYFQITPNTAHQVTQMARQLKLIQMFQREFPIDPWSVAEANDIPDFGSPPEGSNTVMERWVAWKKIQAAIMAVQAKLVQEGTNAAGVPGQAGTAGATSLNAQPQGRPPSGMDGARMESKPDGEGGSRQTITNS